jgi:outer membrane receptor for ferrienterochelin and colicins
MIKHHIFLIGSLLSISFLFSQEKKQDTTNVETLNDIIVTGQLLPQAVKKSVFEVKVISQKDIQKQAGNNLSDLLSNQLNLTVTPNTNSGRSTVSLFGLDGQYFKILIDGIPMVSDTGLGNDVDLTQISLENIKQIEIVEGSMAVAYGENAVTGIINIISKKSSKYKWEIGASLQEETVGNEYKAFTEGRHIQTFKIAHNLSDNFFASVHFSRNEFDGFLDQQQGQFYNQSDFLRGHKWLPKEQYNIKTLLNYRKKGINIFYKFDFFNEKINLYNPVVDQNIHAATQIANPFGIDKNFDSNRFAHHLNANGNFKNNIRFNLSASYQKQTKDVEIFQFFINTLEEQNNETTEYLSTKIVHSKGTFSNFIQNKNYNFQVGYELSIQDGFSSSITGLFNGNNIENILSNYDFFTAVEFNISNVWSLRPGARLSFQSDFDTQFAGSLSSKWRLKNGFTLRNIIGTSYRTPNFEELFTFFVDSNHDVQGNADLKPEKSYSFFTHLNKVTWLNDDTKLSNKLKLTYLDISDKITLAIIDASSSPIKFKFINIDAYKFLGISLNNSINYKHLKFQLGLSLSGISETFDSETNSKDDFLYSFEANSSISYTIPKWQTSFNLSYKFNGEQSEFVQRVDTNGDTVFEKGKRAAYSWMDLSIQKRFYNNKITTTLGARNLFDINDIKTTTTETPSNITLGYGRSYFVKLSYKLNI